jgi:hypothetical protein
MRQTVVTSFLPLFTQRRNVTKDYSRPFEADLSILHNFVLLTAFGKWLKLGLEAIDKIPSAKHVPRQSLVAQVMSGPLPMRRAQRAQAFLHDCRHLQRSP